VYRADAAVSARVCGRRNGQGTAAKVFSPEIRTTDNDIIYYIIIIIIYTRERTCKILSL